MSILEWTMSLEIGLIYGIVAIGIFFSFRIIDFPDLTCDGSFSLGAATSAILIENGYNPYFALLISVIAGSLAGCCTGILNIRFNISNLLSGILVAFMLYSINLKIMHNVPNITLPINNTIFANNNVQILLIAITLVVVALSSFLFTTDLGLAFRSIGQNKRFAKNIGVNISTGTILVLALSNATISFAGGIFAQHQGFADISLGVGTVIFGFAAVIIGQKVFPFRKTWCQLFACLVGSIIYRILVGFALGSEYLGLQTQDLNLVTGIMIIVIMIASNSRGQNVTA